MQLIVRQSVLPVVLGIALFVAGCGGGASGGGSSPTSPTSVATPSGCSGSPVGQVAVQFGGTDGNGINLQVFGETFNQPIAAGDQFTVTRSVVPCSYEVVGQMLGRSLTVMFGRTSPFTNREAGVELGSVVVEEGPSWVFGPTDNSCAVRFNASSPNGPPPPGPFNIRIRFRVANSNGVQSSGTGCGTPVAVVAPTPTPTPPPTPVGNFNGTYSGDAVGTGSFRLTAIVTGTVVSGVLRTPITPPVQGTIPITGTATASGAVAFTAIDDCGAAQYRMTGQITVGSSGSAVMAGTWEEDGAVDCRGATSGTFTLTRQ